MTAQNFQPAWDFQAVQVPTEWFIHVITIKRAPTGLAGEDDAGSRIPASAAAATILHANIHAFVQLVDTDPRGPEDATARLVIKRRHTVWTDINLNDVRRGDLVLFYGRSLEVEEMINADEQELLWKLKTIEYLN